MSMSISGSDARFSRGPDRTAAVRAWLYIVAFLVFLMVLVGGATRLTDSGLSITEWKPVTGTIPPLSESDWTAEFEKYQQIPEYDLVNKGMTLEEFKWIYGWEWGHRFLGRLIGVVFAVPFLWFLLARRIPKSVAPSLVGLFVLGGLQGAIGWWMVKSGLVDRVDVSQYRLAVHLTTASIIFAAILWVARRLAPDATTPAATSARLFSSLLIVLVLVQIFLGGLVAGLDAGLTYTTWPLMDGHWIPPRENLLVVDPAWRNFFENVLTVQFDHRMSAYLIVVLTALHAFAERARSPGSIVALRAQLLFFLAFAQTVLGITTLVTAVPLGLGLAHQATAMLVLGVAVLHRAGMGSRR